MFLKDTIGNRVILVDLLAILFGISSWISINGLWVELPMLVHHLPEGWALPSYLSIIVQIANIGPITYGLMRKCLSSPPSQHISVILLLVIGCISSLVLVLGWDLTTLIADKDRSTGLFISVFFLSLVDCTSSVLFLPYMASFKQMYLNSYLIGEGMSGFVPSLAALAQGVSGNPECVNGTMVEVADQARFSTSAFFMFLMVMMLLSLMAFLCLQYLPLTQTEKVINNNSSTTNFSNEIVNAANDEYSNVSDDSDNNTEPVEELTQEENNRNIYQLLAIQCIVCCLSNGALPSIQSYSCLPYGNTVYHFAVTLNAMANPLMAFLAFFLPCNRRSVVYLLTVLGCALSGYILATAAYSPDMIGGVTVGGTLVVLTWVTTGALFSYVKVCVAGMCRNSGYLFSCGVVTQIGSAVGALVMFLLVNEAQLFEGYYVTC